MDKHLAIESKAYDWVFNSSDKKIQIWFCLRYNRPILHDKFEDYTEEDILLEYYIVQMVSDDGFVKDFEQRSGRKKQEEIEDQEWLKRQMGNDYVAPPDINIKL